MGLFTQGPSRSMFQQDQNGLAPSSADPDDIAGMKARLRARATGGEKNMQASPVASTENSPTGMNPGQQIPTAKNSGAQPESVGMTTASADSISGLVPAVSPGRGLQTGKAAAALGPSTDPSATVDAPYGSSAMNMANIAKLQSQQSPTMPAHHGWRKALDYAGGVALGALTFNPIAGLGFGKMLSQMGPEQSAWRGRNEQLANEMTAQEAIGKEQSGEERIAAMEEKEKNTAALNDAKQTELEARAEKEHNAANAVKPYKVTFGNDGQVVSVSDGTHEAFTQADADALGPEASKAFSSGVSSHDAHRKEVASDKQAQLTAEQSAQQRGFDHQEKMRRETERISREAADERDAKTRSLDESKETLKENKSFSTTQAMHDKVYALADAAMGKAAHAGQPGVPPNPIAASLDVVQTLGLGLDGITKRINKNELDMLASSGSVGQRLANQLSNWTSGSRFSPEMWQAVKAYADVQFSAKQKEHQENLNYIHQAFVTPTKTAPNANTPPAAGTTQHYQEGADEYDIPAEKAAAFEKKHPNAKLVK